jgi:hypothetical protein
MDSLQIIIELFTDGSRKSKVTADRNQSEENSCQKSNSISKQKFQNSYISRNRMHLRRSDVTQIERARTRTLRMTLIIVLAFVLCWTPYVFIVLLYQIDSDAAKNLDVGLRDTLFMFAVSNSCVNPLVYGSYAMNFRRIWKKYFKGFSFKDCKRNDSNREHESRRSTYIDENTTYSNCEVSSNSPLTSPRSEEQNGYIC